MRELLQKVVAEGTGKNAKVEGFEIGGKTATSHTIPRSEHRYIASFIGFALELDPDVLVLLIIDNPQGTYYGGTIAAPVAGEIFGNILPYRDILNKMTYISTSERSSFLVKRKYNRCEPMKYEGIIPVLLAFAVTEVVGPFVIPFLRRLKVGHTERKEVDSHLKKNVTSTMVGIMIIAAIAVTSLFYVKDYPKIVPILFMMSGFGVSGFLDDDLKVGLRQSEGRLPWQEMRLQIVVTTIFAVCMVRYSDVALTRLIPFSGGKYLNIGGASSPLMYLAVSGTVNRVNFTDGVDG